MLMNGTPHALEEATGKYAHVARKDHELDVSGQDCGHLILGRGRPVPEGDVRVRNAEGLDVGLVVGMVRDHADDLRIEVSPPRTPEQVQQTVLLTRDQHGDATRLVRIGEPPIHAERLGDVRHEAPLEIVARAAFQTERHPHVERPALGLGRVLVRLDDVRPLLEQEARNSCDDARAVGARDEQVGGAAGAHRKSSGYDDSFSAPSAVMRKLSSTRSPPPPGQ